MVKVKLEKWKKKKEIKYVFHKVQLSSGFRLCLKIYVQVYP